MTGTCVSGVLYVCGDFAILLGVSPSLKTLFDKQDTVASGITDISVYLKERHFEMPQLKHNN